MLRIKINKDIEEYKSGVARGLSLKQIGYGMLTIIIICTLIAILRNFVGNLMSVYISTFIAAPFALIGFGKGNGMDFGTMLKKNINFRKHCNEYQKGTWHNAELIKKLYEESKGKIVDTETDKEVMTFNEYKEKALRNVLLFLFIFLTVIIVALIVL